MQQEPDPFTGLETDLHPPLGAHEASVEADRCYFCHDAPCVTACPTGIDIPLFIRQIQTGNPVGSAKTIFDENILGGMCARVCPTETLCEQVCVRQTAEDKPVKIGALQRYATDHLLCSEHQLHSERSLNPPQDLSLNHRHPYLRAESSGKKVCVIGAGPAGLSCAHRLARYGHEVTLFDAGAKPGGLNEYGIASYKTVNNFAQQEVDFILSVGGITLQTGVRLGVDFSLQEATDQYDAVFLGVGLDSVNKSNFSGSTLSGVTDAVEFIAALRQSQDYSSLSIGRRVVVIGGGMTAIDAAVQASMLGAEDVTIAYRRPRANMNASVYEQQLAQTHGVKIKHSVQPVKIIAGGNNSVTGVEFEYTTDSEGGLSGTGETYVETADQLLMAIGQAFDAEAAEAFGLALGNRRLRVDANRKTSHDKIWAGGDCIDVGEDLTVWAVQDGKLAAESIHRSLS